MSDRDQAYTSVRTVFNSGGVSNVYHLNEFQDYALDEAAQLWNDVANVNWHRTADDVDLARLAVTREWSLFGGEKWAVSLGNDWTRVIVGDITDASVLGLNKATGAKSNYRELYLDTSLDGLADFERGSRAFYTLIHELGHSMDFDHLNGSRTQTIMGARETNLSSSWYASTPMILDIDALAGSYGLKTTTRLGNDTYGFNANLSGPYRGSYDFEFNKRPLVTIYDNGGLDTLDASGFSNSDGSARDVELHLGYGETSYVDGTPFAVIYRNSLIESGIGGSGSDSVWGNDAGNFLMGLGGNDKIYGLAGGDQVYGNRGSDFLYGGDGNDYIYGGQDNDLVSGDDGDDVLFGNMGNDNILGGKGMDLIFGGQGNDIIYGLDGADLLIGDKGDDTLLGGLGSDRYEFNLDSGNDVIADFSYADGDRIVLKNQVMTSVTSSANGNALLSLSGGGTIELKGISGNDMPYYVFDDSNLPIITFTPPISLR